ncbi:DNA-directed RNA polymerase I subunit RPA12 [Diorhabda carinulata]|uniref:DNA-directed RNA polymerase I subunit RPA12 n=1 Tax=Diorhabda carinulata TaxID=1163345 RepID=UPI0025A2CD0B|nr:DNA-directed RNA polymerase I subunit RPA12 [Diorhabda carinulata]
MSSSFTRIPGFCPDCGSILPSLQNKGGVTCYSCSRIFSEDAEEVFGTSKVKYTIVFNSREAKKKNIKEDKRQKTNEVEEEGPVVERKCPKCGNDKMSYATLQLRSADEGQTVFYTCTKCKYKESENS